MGIQKKELRKQLLGVRGEFFKMTTHRKKMGPLEPADSYMDT